MTRGSNFVDLPFFKSKAKTGKKSLPKNQQQQQVSLLSQHANNNIETDKHSPSGMDDGSGNDSMDGTFGRGKRKRVLPSRYDDNDFEVLNKKNRSGGSISNGNSMDASYVSMGGEEGVAPEAAPRGGGGGGVSIMQSNASRTSFSNITKQGGGSGTGSGSSSSKSGEFWW